MTRAAVLNQFWVTGVPSERPTLRLAEAAEEKVPPGVVQRVVW